MAKTKWQPLNRFRFIQEWKKYGFKTAWYNLKFIAAYKALGAKSMRVTTKKK